MYGQNYGQTPAPGGVRGFVHAPGVPIVGDLGRALIYEGLGRPCCVPTAEYMAPIT